LLQYRCHVGHSFSPEALVAGQHEATERALWVALRTLEERASMLTILAQRSQPSKKIAQRYEEKGVEARAHADVIRSLLLERRFTKSNVRSAEKKSNK